jgi:hypothetical protein
LSGAADTSSAEGVVSAKELLDISDDEITEVTTSGEFPGWAELICGVGKRNVYPNQSNIINDKATIVFLFSICFIDPFY